MKSVECMVRKDNEILQKLLDKEVEKNQKLEKEVAKLKEPKGFSTVCLECGRTGQVGIQADYDGNVIIECGCGNRQVL